MTSVAAPGAPDATASEVDAGSRSRASTQLEFWATGGATLLLLPLCWLLPRLFGFDRADLALGFLTFYGAHVINDPHFAVSYLLLYRDVRRRLWSRDVPLSQRLRYWLAMVVAPAVLLVWGLSALLGGSARSLGSMTQLMFLLVGWHYVKQGFGVVTVLSGRRGIGFSAGERRALLLHAFAGWAYGWASPFDPGRLVEEKGVIFRTLAQPTWLEPLTRAVFFGSALWLVVALAGKWRREGSLPLSPLLGFLVSVWVWTVFSGIDPLFMYLIPALHSVQYLYFVWLLKRNQARAHEGPPAFGKPVAVVVGAWFAGSAALGLLLFHLLPDGLDSALVDRKLSRLSDLGATPYFAAIFTFVNLHHYFMDFALWRRENPELKYLRD